VPESAMSEQPQKSTKTQLALAVAQGVPVERWAHTNGVARRTAFRWAKESPVRRAKGKGSSRRAFAGRSPMVAWTGSLPGAKCKGRKRTGQA
jgi:hypothetical protein